MSLPLIHPQTLLCGSHNRIITSDGVTVATRVAKQQHEKLILHGKYRIGYRFFVPTFYVKQDQMCLKIIDRQQHQFYPGPV